MENISNVEIEIDEFLKIFKGDEHQQKMLDALNKEATKDYNL